jgi:hypothetical protein
MKVGEVLAEVSAVLALADIDLRAALLHQRSSNLQSLSEATRTGALDNARLVHPNAVQRDVSCYRNLLVGQAFSVVENADELSRGQRLDAHCSTTAPASPKHAKDPGDARRH